MNYLNSYKTFESMGDKYSLTVFACDRNSPNTQAKTLRFSTIEEFHEQMGEFESEVEFRKFFFEFDMIDTPDSMKNLPENIKKRLIKDIESATDEWYNGI